MRLRVSSIYVDKSFNEEKKRIPNQGVNFFFLLVKIHNHRFILAAISCLYQQ